MQLQEELRKQRLVMKLSQEELAEKLFVSRQSISNWETGKTYPDIHSLLLMSTLFDISIDQLLKGDIKIMENEIQEIEINEFKKYSTIFSILLCSSILSFAPLLYFLEEVGLVIAIVLWGVTLLVSWKVEKLKKENDIQTYKGILSFYNGQRLDDINKQREYGKRVYQKVLLAFGAGMITFVIVMVCMRVLSGLN